MSDERITEEELLYIFDELVTNATKFIPDRLQKERDDAYKQIRQIIKYYFNSLLDEYYKKPEIDEKYAEEKARELFNSGGGLADYEDAITQIISDARRTK